MNSNKKRIIFDAERMKYPHTGLYHYCHQLGNAIQQHIDNDSEEIFFYVRQSERKSFGENGHYINQHSFHKFWMPSMRSFNIWHANYQATQYFPKRSNLKIVLTVHDLNFLHEQKEEYKIEREIKKLQHKINNTDHIIAISEFTANDIKKHIDIRDTPLSVIHNGCNLNNIKSLNTPTLVPSNKFLFTIGTITQKKNFHVLPALLEKNNLELIIAGITSNEDYKEKIIEEAKKIGVENRVVFTGAITENDKQWYLQNCEAFLFPSLAEGFGLPVIEAMQYGVPVILSKSTALPEIGGDDAYYFGNFNPVSMQNDLVEFLNDYKNNPEKKDRIIKRSKLFDWNSVAKKYLEVYRSFY